LLLASVAAVIVSVVVAVVAAVIFLDYQWIKATIFNQYLM